VTVLIKLGNDPPSLADAIAGDGFIKVAANVLFPGKVFLPHILEELGHREYCTGIEPLGKIVSCSVVEEYLIGNIPDLLLKCLQVYCTGYLFQGIRIPEDKRAKGKILNNEISQLQGK